MREISQVKLELLRSGPAHNQLLSPLTDYIGICGDDGPATLNMPFEHRKFLMALNLLRYEGNENLGLEANRQAEVRQMGETVGGILAKIPALLAELSRTRCNGSQLIHLRLSLSASELSLIPFETAIAPDAYPGSGSPLLLQSVMPISLTRETRRGHPLKSEWNRTPRILFVYASPAGLPPVPAEGHLAAIREALEPWIEHSDSPEQRVESVKKLLTILQNPTLDELRQTCATTAYTHVHILAHGAPYAYAGDQRFGVALRNSNNPSGMDIVDGTRLAIALMPSDPSGERRSSPTVVSLATCDSGNQVSVLTPGGGIAHELHVAGIPWVFASQFPLWMSASTLFAETLYSGLLGGDDPRWVLYQTRQRLRAALPGNHDWASIIAYASLPKNFEEQLENFRDNQIRQSLNVNFARIDRLVEQSDSGWANPIDLAELYALRIRIRAALADWLKSNHVDPKKKSDRLGVSAAYEKRMAIAYAHALSDNWAPDFEHPEVEHAYQVATRLYKAAVDADPTNHWAITQYLSMLAISRHASSNLENVRERYHDWWTFAYHLTMWQAKQGTSREEQMWSRSSLIELLILGRIYAPSLMDEDVASELIKIQANGLSRLAQNDRFPVEATLRQLSRYKDYWHNELWDRLVRQAINHLNDALNAGELL